MGSYLVKCSLTLDLIGDRFWSFQVVQQAFSFLFLTGHPNQEQKGLAQDSFFRFVSIRPVHVWLSRFFLDFIQIIWKLNLNNTWIKLFLAKIWDKFGKTLDKWYFVYQNCSDLLWEKIVLVIEKNFWNSRLKARICNIFEIPRTIYSNSEI